MINVRQFKILHSHRYRDRLPDGIPWSLIAPHKLQAMHNHGQTLERLDRRGGLSVEELYAVLQDKPFIPVDHQVAVLSLVRLLGKPPDDIICVRI